MALKLPNTLSNLIFSDNQSASLVQQSLTNSVQPLLNFVNQNFTTSGSGQSVLLTLNQALTLTKQLLVATGTQTNPSVAFSQNNTLGFFYDQANLRMGLVINNTLVGFISAAGMNAQSPSSSGNAFTFYNSSGTAVGSVNNAGTFTSLAPSGTANFVSQNGFRHTIRMGYVYVTSTTANQSQQCIESLSTVGGGAYNQPRYYQETMPAAGSILAIVVDCNVTLNSAQTIAVYKNGTAISGCTLVINPSATNGAQTFPKSKYTFAAYDVLYATVTYAAAVSSTTAASFVKLSVEMAP